MNNSLKTRILLVEDEGITALDIKNDLAGRGYEVVGIASTGDQAIEMTIEHSPDIIIMDIILRGEMDGITASEIINENYDIPILYQTAHSDTATLERAKRTEPYGYIMKPINPDEMFSTIEIALYKHQMEKKLKLSEAKFRNYNDKAPQGIVVIDIGSMKFLEVNKKVCEMTGYSEEELRNYTILDLTKENARERTKQEFKQLLENEEIKGEQKGFIKKDGSIGYWTISAVMISENRCLVFIVEREDDLSSDYVI